MRAQKFWAVRADGWQIILPRRRGGIQGAIPQRRENIGIFAKEVCIFGCNKSATGSATEVCRRDPSFAESTEDRGRRRPVQGTDIQRQTDLRSDPILGKFLK